MLSIVLLEDDRTFSRLIQDALSAANIDVVPVFHARDLLAVVDKVQPALIVVDLALPEIDGVSAIETLRTTPETAEIPIVVATALAHTDARRRAEEAGCDVFMVKPFRIPELIHVIDRMTVNR